MRTSALVSLTRVLASRICNIGLQNHVRDLLQAVKNKEYLRMLSYFIISPYVGISQRLFDLFYDGGLGAQRLARDDECS